MDAMNKAPQVGPQPRDRTALADIGNTSPNTHAAKNQRSNTKPVRPAQQPVQQGDTWTMLVNLKFLYLPLSEFILEINTHHSQLIMILAQQTDWSIRLIKDFQNTRGAGKKFDARLRPRGPLCCVGQRLFMSTQTLHCCIVVERKGFLWLNRFSDESFIRVNWLEDALASVRILPPLNICFDLDETLIFNAPVKGCTAGFEYVVQDPPHVLKSEADQDTGSDIPSSDKPLRRPFMDEFLNLVCPHFRNTRVATFSVQNRAEEIVDNLDKDQATLLKNKKQCHTTGQPPVQTVVFAREQLLQQCVARAKAKESGTSPRKGAEAITPTTWYKSLDMLDLPHKGLLERSIIIDDRSDVWAPNNQENIVKICGPDKPLLVGNPKYMNGHDGGELGSRIALALINLELRATCSSAFIPKCNEMCLPPPVRMTGRRTLMGSPVPAPSARSVSPNNNTRGNLMQNLQNMLQPASPTMKAELRPMTAPPMAHPMHGHAVLGAGPVQNARFRERSEQPITSPPRVGQVHNLMHHNPIHPELRRKFL